MKPRPNKSFPKMDGWPLVMLAMSMKKATSTLSTEKEISLGTQIIFSFWLFRYKGETSISPSELERIIQQHPAVCDVVVVSSYNERKEEVLFQSSFDSSSRYPKPLLCCRMTSFTTTLPTISSISSIFKCPPTSRSMTWKFFQFSLVTTLEKWWDMSSPWKRGRERECQLMSEPALFVLSLLSRRISLWIRIECL